VPVIGIVEAATRLFDLLAAHDTTFTRHLLPGLSRAEIQALVDPLGVVLSEEAIQFYERYSLPKGYQYGTDQPHFFGIYWMLGLEDAVEQYQFNEYSDYFSAENESFPGENEGSGGWFPFLQEDANFYLLDTFHTANGLCPIIQVPEAGGPEPKFVSMTAMFETMYDWIKEAALAVEDGHLVGNYEGDRVTVGQIAERHNPGVASWKRDASGRVSIYR
jgi:hypothetical protein